MMRNIFLAGLTIFVMPFLLAKVGLNAIEIATVSFLAAIGWCAILYRRMNAASNSGSVQGSSSPSQIQGHKKSCITPQEDFLFGKVHVTRNGEPFFWLNDVLSVAKDETEYSFTAHLIRFMSSQRPNCSVVFLGETSAPDFQSILEKIANEQIGKIVIRARDDVNQNTKTLECSLHLIHGTVTIRPEWNGWQPERAEEIVSTLLLPLVKQSLLGRVRIERSDGNQEALPNNFMAVIGDVLALTGHPLSSSQLPERMPRYIRLLTSAQ